MKDWPLSQTYTWDQKRHAQKNIVTGEDTINIDGDWGTLNGKGFNYNLDSSIIILKGRPKLSLYNNKGNNKWKI